jgi:hypothetical protein
MAVVFKIHPAIGIARVGNSADYYLAPETPGGLPLDHATGKPIYTGPGAPPQNVFHDKAGAVKKQAARFKVFAYDNAKPDDPGVRVEVGKTQVGGKKVTGIEWTVYLANKKAAWFEFAQLTGSGQEGDAGYLNNNKANPGNKNPNLPFNPLRSNKALGLSSDPSTINDPKRKHLLLDPGPRTVAGANAAPQDFKIAPKGIKPFEITTLGRVLTDQDSNLIVLGGNGCSGTTDQPPKIGAYANNSGWFDDVSDGPVTGHLVLEDGSKVEINVPSWVLCGPPGYAPEIFNLVTLYDTMYDVFVRNFGFNPALFRNGAFQQDYQPNQAAEVTPILIRPNLYRYVAAIPTFGRNSHAALPIESPSQFPASLMRGPTDINTPDLMPVLAGDNPISNFEVSNFLSLTATQFFILNQYAAGKASTAAPAALGEGVALDVAALMNCVGGAFCPGIEMTWISRNLTIYMPMPANPSLSDAFRLRHKTLGSGGLTLTNGDDNDYTQGLEPGDVIKYMAQPWQADFNECSTQPIQKSTYWWWPAQRPYSVYPAANPGMQLQWTREADDNANEFADLQMVTCWKDLGFILNIGADGTPSLVEVERNQKAISAYKPPSRLTS